MGCVIPGREEPPAEGYNRELMAARLDLTWFIRPRCYGNVAALRNEDLIAIHYRVTSICVLICHRYMIYTGGTPYCNCSLLYT